MLFRSLSEAEIDAARELLAGNGLLATGTAIAGLTLEEPAKDEVLVFKPGDPVDRRVRTALLDVQTGAVNTVLISLTHKRIDQVTALDPAVDGQPPIMLEEFFAVDEIVKADEGWRAAMARRGITDLSLVRACPLSAGHFDLPGEHGRRMLRALSFLANRESDHCWAHPIDGVTAYVDLIERPALIGRASCRERV